MVGMQRTTGRPKKAPRGWEHCWPFRATTKAEATEYPRGTRREAYTALPPQSRLQWIKAELWLDSLWVTMLATSFFSATSTTVLRWTAEACMRLPRSCSATLARYAKNMGHADRFNRALADTRMAMGRCKQRFHRSMFLGWLLPAIMINIMILFVMLWPVTAMKKLKKSKHCATLGFSRWFQQQLGEALIEVGVRLSKEELGDSELRAELGLAPSFMPMNRQRKATGCEAYTFPVAHKLVKAFDGGKLLWGWNNRCKRCHALAKRDGGRGLYHPDKPWHATSNQMVPKMPGGGNVPRCTFGCSICKVYLCTSCFRMQDDDGVALPNCWDHRAGSRGLMALTVLTE